MDAYDFYDPYFWYDPEEALLAMNTDYTKLSKPLASLKASVIERIETAKNLRADKRKLSDIEKTALEIAMLKLNEAFEGFNAALGG